MAFIIDDDFQSYTLGQLPPFGNLFIGGVINPFISNTPQGIFGDTKSVTMPAIDGLIWPVAIPDGTQTPYQQFSFFQGLWLGHQTDQQGTLLRLYNNLNVYNRGNMGNLFVNSDGTLGFSVDGGAFLYSNYSMLTEKWYWIQTNISYSTNGSGLVVCDVDVAVNNVSVMSGTLTSNRRASDFLTLYVNNFTLGGASGGSLMGRLTVSDTILPIGTNPHPGTPVAFVSQGVIELIKHPISSPPLTLACPIGTATIGVPYDAFMIAGGGQPPYTFAIPAGALPTGLSLNVATGEISGTPTASGLFSYTITVTDFFGITTPAACSILVAGLANCSERFGPKLYFWEPSYLDRPEDIQMRATDWENAGLVGAKFMQGFTLECDTQGVDKVIKIQGDQNDLQTYTINHNGQQIKPYVFDPTQVASLLRIISPDSVDWRYFGVRWIWEPIPELVTYYETQGTTHDLSGYQFLKDGYIALISTTDVTLTINVDGTNFVYTIPSTGGLYKKNYILFGINGSTGQTLKGKLYSYILESEAGFRLFQKDCEVRVHAWGVGNYQVRQPFGETSRVYGARI